QATDSMLDITQSVRKMYAVSKGKADIDLRPLPVCEAVDHIRSVFSSELDRKRVRIHYVDEQKYSVLVDPISFKNQVFANVISNAIKFSPVGGTITINCQKLNDDYVV